MFTFIRLLADLYNREREEWEAEVHSRCVYLDAVVGVFGSCSCYGYSGECDDSSST